MATPHFDHSAADEMGDNNNTTVTDTLKGGGAELGYRYYTGKQGFDGFYMGPSLVVARYELTSKSDQPSVHQPLPGGTFTSFGAAFDIGGQWQQDHLVMGGGAGVQYTAVSNDVILGRALLTDVIAGAGVRPRLAFNVGYVF